MDRQRSILVLAVTGLVVNVALNALLIPSFGYLGAAATTVFVELLVLISLASHLRAILSPRAWTDALLRPLMAVVPPLVAIELLMSDVSVAWRLAAADLCILMLIVLLRVFDEHERAEMRRLIHRTTSTLRPQC
jgi:O-antigen/teichoic acid export membrane protein